MGKFERKYTVDHNFFNTIDTEEKAYILGFLYADGCNTYDKSKCKYIISIAQLEQDIDILNKILFSLHSNYKLYKIVQSENNKIKYKVEIASKRMSLDLIKVGCSPRKTFTITFPDENLYFKKNLYPHFIRGYFDGDGCI